MNPSMHPSRRDVLRLAALGGLAGSALGPFALAPSPAAAAGPSTFSPIRPPATPLAVRSPYLSTWLRADNLPGSWPTFWAGAVTAITGIVRVDGQPYVFMGAPSGGWPLATQTALTVTATRSTFTITAGPVRLEVEFLSPVDPASLRRQSVPMSYLSVTVSSADAGTHQVSLYVDVSGEWAHGDRTRQIGWATQATGGQRVHTFQPTSPAVLAEVNDQATWGTVVWSTDDVAGLTWQTGADTTVRAQAATTGALANTADANQPRAINSSWPVFAFNRALGAITANTQQTVAFVIGHVRTPAVSYLGANLDPWWRTHWTGWPDMLAWFRADRDTARAVAAATDAQVDAWARQAVGAPGTAADQYAALCALAVRQAFGGTELVNRGGSPWVMLKEISSNGDFSTVDVIYPAFPAYLQLSPRWLELLLAPLFDYTEVRGFDKPFAPHDLGVYPNAFGRIGQPEEDMPVEESANLLVMVAALLTRMPAARASAYATAHYAKLKQWADYLVANLPDPGNQNQTDDFTGFIAHSVNLALKGIVGIGAMDTIARWAGQGSTYAATARSYIAQWATMAQNAARTHLKLTYDGADTTWSLKYNGFADRIAATNLVPATIAAEEASWYLQNQHAYGVPLDPRHTYTKVDWELWTAAFLTGQSAARDALIAKAYTFASTTPSRVPFTDWHDTDTGNQSGFAARPVIGGVLALATLRHAPNGLTGAWPLKGGQLATPGEDASGNGNDATGSPLTTARPVVRTDGSFTVMARVNPTDLGGFRTAVSQDGARVSGFFLQYCGSDGRWAFAMTAADADGAASTRAVASTPAATGVWAHLAGVYDAEAGQLRLYVDGVLRGQAAYTAGWPAAGPLAIGRARWNGAAADTFAGAIEDVRTYDHALPAATISAAAGLATSQVAALQFDVADASLTLSGGAALGGGYSGSALVLNGSTGYATVQRLVDTSASFSVSAWVQLAATSNFATVAGQDGAQASGFYLQYSAADNAWAFAMVAADQPNAAATRAVSPFPPRVDGWTHLAGVRDASSGRLRLYVDGVLVADVAASPAWAAGGAFTIGRGKWNGGDADHFPGRIDQLKVWTRALTDADVRAIA
ncbi:glutaminase domain-containing protein [Dactylosporangium sp. CA-139066]|uniref:glutaminase domain-containing protein n=1 Tax=Dactylosporangium sp. CA-139066 TaxID=3239930 RepID=UPI003D89E16C